MAKPKPRAVDRPHHDIIFKLSTHGIEVRDCSLQIGTVPQILVRDRDVIWWLAIHRGEPDAVWTSDMIAHIATTAYGTAVVSGANEALLVLRSRLWLTREQKYRLGGLLASGEHAFTQGEVEQALAVDRPHYQEEGQEVHS